MNLFDIQECSDLDVEVPSFGFVERDHLLILLSSVAQCGDGLLDPVWRLDNA